MTSINELTSAIRIKAVSPDNSIEARLTGEDGVTLRCRPGSLRHHTASSFAEQVRLALTRLTSGSIKAADMVRTRIVGEPSDEPVDEFNRHIAEERIRHARRLIAAIEAEAHSPHGHVHIRVSGGHGYSVEISQRAISILDEMSIMDEVNAALQGALIEYNTQATVAQNTVLNHRYESI